MNNHNINYVGQAIRELDLDGLTEFLKGVRKWDPIIRWINYAEKIGKYDSAVLLMKIATIQGRIKQLKFRADNYSIDHLMIIVKMSPTKEIIKQVLQGNRNRTVELMSRLPYDNYRKIFRYAPLGVVEQYIRTCHKDINERFQVNGNSHVQVIFENVLVSGAKCFSQFLCRYNNDLELSVKIIYTGSIETIKLFLESKIGRTDLFDDYVSILKNCRSYKTKKLAALCMLYEYHIVESAVQFLTVFGAIIGKTVEADIDNITKKYCSRNGLGNVLFDLVYFMNNGINFCEDDIRNLGMVPHGNERFMLWYMFGQKLGTIKHVFIRDHDDLDIQKISEIFFNGNTHEANSKTYHLWDLAAYANIPGRLLDDRQKNYWTVRRIFVTSFSDVIIE